MSGATDSTPSRRCETAWATGSAGNRRHNRQHGQQVAHRRHTRQVVQPTAWVTNSAGNRWPTDSTPDRWHDQQHGLRVVQLTVWATDGTTNIVTLQTYS